MKGFAFPFQIHITICEALSEVYEEEQEKRAKKLEQETPKYSYSAINKLRALVLSAPAFHFLSTTEFRDCVSEQARQLLQKANAYIQREDDLSDHLAQFKAMESTIVVLTDERNQSEFIVTVFLSGFEPSGGGHRAVFEDPQKLKELKLTAEFLNLRFSYR